MNTVREVMEALKSAGTEQNRKIYKRHGAGDVLFGVSFANLEKLKKEIISDEGKKGVNHDLSLELWETGNADAQTFATLIAEPMRLDGATLRSWVKSVNYYLLADLLGNIVAQSKEGLTIIKEWTSSNKEFIKRTGYSALNYLAREDESLEDAYFETHINIIAEELQASANRAKEGMNNCLIAIGGRNESLRDRALKAAKKIGKVEIDHGETSCKTFIIEDYINKIWARKNKH